jgi:succinyl-diaminopimelate desuccinylase
MQMDAVRLSQELIKCASVTGTDAGIINLLKTRLDELGFKCDVLEFSEEGTYPIINLHAIFNPNNHSDILYFAGHSDVVPAGNEKSWTYPPFDAVIEQGVLYGRGAVDMKSAIAAFICAAAEFIFENKEPNFGIGLLITGDEEADAINGTVKMLDWMKSHGKPISACIVGEPTNPEKIGEMVKVGRRGSINFNLKIIGKQGHVAYPDNADNPITTLTNVLKLLKDRKLDGGNRFFDPSNLEVTYINSTNLGTNVIPKEAEANFNIRFNDQHSSQSLIEMVQYVCSHSCHKYQLTYKVSGESFITEPGFLSDIVLKSVKEETGLNAVLSTTGGTSDARFIKSFCPVVEFGLVNKTAHNIDEKVVIDDIYLLKKVYKKILELYSKRP